MTLFRLLLIILAVIIVILLSPFSLALSYNDGVFSLKLRSLFFNKTYGNSKDSDDESSIEGKSNKKKSKKKEISIIDFCLLFQKTAYKTFNWIRKTKISNFNLEIDISDPEAANAAIKYGEICSVIYPIYGYLYNKVGIKKSNLVINCNYDNFNKVNFYIKIYDRLVFINITLITILYIVFMYFISKKRNQKNNNKKTK